MLFFASRHDGVALEAVGRVVLTAAHAERADPDAESYPAIVNHVVFFGDGISQRTVLRGFTITGANNFASRSEGPEPIQPDSSNGVRWEKGLFFYADGGGIKVFGRSYPTLEGLELHDNYASPCGGGISIEHRGFDAEAVLIKNSVFRNNSCQITGAAVDVLPGSAAVLDNCLFVGNVANLGPDYVGRRGGVEYNKAHGSGALTVFPGARVEVRDCTFTDNWNGVDDKGRGSMYSNTIFWMNVRGGGIAPGSRYEVDLLDSRPLQWLLYPRPNRRPARHLGPEAQCTPSTRSAVRRALPTPSPCLCRSGLPTAGGIEPSLLLIKKPALPILSARPASTLAQLSPPWSFHLC